MNAKITSFLLIQYPQFKNKCKKMLFKKDSLLPDNPLIFEQYCLS